MCAIATPSNAQAVRARCCPEDRAARYEGKGHTLPKHPQIHLLRMQVVPVGFSNAPPRAGGTADLAQVI